MEASQRGRQPHSRVPRGQVGVRTGDSATSVHACMRAYMQCIHTSIHPSMYVCM